MKKFIAFALLFLITSNCIAGPGWVMQSTPFSNITDLQFVNSQTGFITGNQGGNVAKSTNGGASWIMISVPHTELQMTAVDFINENTGWVSGYKVVQGECCNYFIVYFKTTNGGQSWDSLPQGWGNRAISDIHLFSKDSVIIANILYYDLSSGGDIRYTNNSGTSFDNSNFISTPFHPSYQFYSLRFLNNTGWVCASSLDDTGLHKTFVYKSSNRGVDWNYIYKDTIVISPFFPKKVTDVVFINDNTGFVCGERGKLSGTTNGGIEWWDRNTFGLSINFSSFFFINSNTGFLTASSYSYPADSSALKRSTDAGVSWQTMRNSVLSSIKKITFVDDLTGWAFGNAGLMKTVTGGLTSVSPIGTEIPGSYSLKQNYPNPFNPTTNIQYDLPNSNFVSLKVYDAAGNEVETLVNENQNPGSYSVAFNASSYPSGVYFYKFVTEKFSETKKMVLIK